MKVLKKIIKWILIVFVILLGVLFYRGYTLYEDLTDGNTVYDQVQKIELNPTFVPFENLPQTFVDATISIEDHRFFEHHGVDYIGLVRAFASWFVPEMLDSGGSTITQQLAKNMYGMFDSSLDRKLVEFFVAKDLESQFTKEEIFTLYVNVINYGDNHIGIYQASHGYFNKSVLELTDNECTLLAGIPQSPANYQLSNHYAQAKSRQRLVLKRMVEEGYMSEEEAREIVNFS